MTSLNSELIVETTLTFPPSTGRNRNLGLQANGYERRNAPSEGNSRPIKRQATIAWLA
jgi:hypothetical protein